MIREWYTARELAEMKLPAMPETKSAMIRRAKREGWKFQERRASGGGNEYHVSALPAQVQAALIDAIVREGKLQDTRTPILVPAAAAEQTRGPVSTEERRQARLVIVSLFDKFRQSCGLKTVAAEQPFMTLYRAHRTAGASDIFPVWLFPICGDFSVQTLRRWRAARRENSDVLGGRYGNRKGTGVIERAENGALKDFISALLVKQTHLTAGHVRDLCRAQFGAKVKVKNQRTGDAEDLKLPKIRAFERHIARWKSDNADVFEKMTNPDRHKSRMQISIGRADAGIDRLNQLWEIDASPADVLCEDGRYSLYALIDVWSRRALFLVTKTPRSEASLLLVRRGLIEWGVPEILRTDNGSDFKSYRFMSAINAFEITQDICQAYTPESKPFVERVIGTIQRDLMPVLPGFVGHNVADAQQIRAKNEFAKRLGESDAEAFTVSLTAQNLQDYIDRWASDKYGQREHSAMGMSPAARAASWTQPVRRIANIRAADVMLSPLAGQDGWRTIGKKGLRVSKGHYYGAGMELYVGKRVLVRCHPEDMGIMYVFDEDGKFICEAKNHDRLGADRATVSAEAKARQKRAIAEGTKELRRAARKITPESIAEGYLSSGNDGGTITLLPRKSESYSTPALDEAVRAIARAPLEAKLTRDQQDAHDKVIAEYHRPAAPRERDEDRWRRTQMDIQRRLDAGEPVSQDDMAWIDRNRDQSWFLRPVELRQAMNDGA